MCLFEELRSGRLPRVTSEATRHSRQARCQSLLSAACIQPVNAAFRSAWLDDALLGHVHHLAGLTLRDSDEDFVAATSQKFTTEPLKQNQSVMGLGRPILWSAGAPDRGVVCISCFHQKFGKCTSWCNAWQVPEMRNSIQCWASHMGFGWRVVESRQPEEKILAGRMCGVHCMGVGDHVWGLSEGLSSVSALPLELRSHPELTGVSGVPRQSACVNFYVRILQHFLMILSSIKMLARVGNWWKFSHLIWAGCAYRH